MPRGYPGTKPPHGTSGRYSNHGCRCAKCRAANSEYHRSYTHRVGMHKPRDLYNAERKVAALLRDNHGTELRYTKHGCRCVECREASRVARARRRARVAA